MTHELLNLGAVLFAVFVEHGAAADVASAKVCARGWQHRRRSAVPAMSSDKLVKMVIVRARDISPRRLTPRVVSSGGNRVARCDAPRRCIGIGTYVD